MRKSKKNEINITENKNLTKQIYFKNLSDINFKFDLVRNTIHNLISLYEKVSDDFNFKDVEENNKDLISKIDEINFILVEIINKFDLKF